MVDMNKLSTLTVTSLIMAISFTVLAVAGIFYTVYRKGNLKHPVAKIICLFALPFTSFAMWILAGLSMSKTLAGNEALAIFLSILISFAILTIIYFVAKYVEEANRKKTLATEIENSKKDDVVEEIADVEEDLSNLKKIIDEVIEEEPEKKIEDVKVEEVKPEPKETNVVIITEKPEEKVEEVKEEVKTTEEPTTEVKVEKITIEKKERKPRAKKEIEVKAEEKVEQPKEELVENKPEEKIEEPAKVEVKEEKIEEDDESDFIKSLSKILEELENNNKDGE